MSTVENDAPAYEPKRVGYITNMGWHPSYDKAKRHVGGLVPITSGNVDLRHTDRLRARIAEALRDMTEHDYIVIAGSPVISAEVFAYVMARFGRVQYLYWEPLISQYLPRSTDGTVQEPSL